MQKEENISVFAVSIAMIGFCRHYPYLSRALLYDRDPTPSIPEGPCPAGMCLQPNLSCFAE